jgi:hypothetical protein
MWQRILRWLAPLLILGSCWLPDVHAQGRRKAVAEEPVETTRSFAFAYTIAFLATIVIMVILCTPSRKAWRG